MYVPTYQLLVLIVVGIREGGRAEAGKEGRCCQIESNGGV